MNLLPNKSTLEIFRDCLRLIPKMVHEPNKVIAVRKLLKQEFFKHRNEKDPEKIQSLRFNAIRGISNYLLIIVKDEYQKNPKNKMFYQEEEEEVIDEEVEQTVEIQEMRPFK